MKNRLIAAALAAFFMLPVFGLTAYATQIDDELGDISHMELVEYAPETDEAPGIDTLDTDTDETPPNYDAEAPEAVELPALPPGTGTIIDYNSDPDGRLFYTIMTPDEHVFYLVIDKSSNTDNVYFLNAVTIADLAALAEIPEAAQGGTAATTTPPVTEPPEQPAETPPPAEQEQPQSGGNMGMYIFIIVLAIAGGGAGWYFKIYRPKQQGAASGEEYDPSMDEAETDYAADWGEDSDEATEGDDSPPWDEDAPAQDGESEDEE